MNKLKIKKIRKVEKGKVYDLTVSENHNFVIEDGILTHNCDYLSINAQAALRKLMEDYSDYCRFILTCNYKEKVIAPVISRCQSFEILPPSIKEVARKLKFILDTEQIKSNPTDILEIVKNYYPDIRKILNVAQQFSTSGELKLGQTEHSELNNSILEILKSTTSKKDAFMQIRTVLANCSTQTYTDLYRFLFENLDKFAKGHIAETILIISEYLYKEAFVVDKEINTSAMFIELLQTIRKD